MLTVPGIYNNGEIKLLEPLPFRKKVKVLITVLEENIQEEDSSIPLNLFDDLIGTISQNKNGSEMHDHHIYKKDH